jgi:hypothetical protein
VWLEKIKNNLIYAEPEKGTTVVVFHLFAVPIL